MSKQTSRQASKQGQNANKQSNNQSSRQTSPANKQTTNIPGKQDSPLNKQASNGSAKQTSPANKQTTNVSVKQDRPLNKQASNGTVKQTNPANKQLTRQAIKQERRQEERQRRLKMQQRATRRKSVLIVSLVVVVVLVAAVSIYYYAKLHNPAGQSQATTTEQVFNASYPPIDGVYCDQLEQTAYHHHVHLTIYLNGQPVSFPAGMGIAGDQSAPTCYYWLHTHATDGIIHIEAPGQHTFVLQNFLDIWQSFAASNSHFTFPTQLSSPAGWTMYVNGKKVQGDFSKINISSNQAWHELITLMYNSPNAKPDLPGSFSWQPGL